MGKPTITALLILPSLHDASHVLLQRHDTKWSLPAFRRNHAPFDEVAAINRYVGHALKIEAVTLRCFRIVRPNANTILQYYALDTRSIRGSIGRESMWATEEDIRLLAFIDPVQRAVLFDWFQWMESADSQRAPWMYRGWVNNAAEWLYDLADRMDLPTNAPVEQTKVWSRACVLQLAVAQDHDLVFKAVPEPFSFEPIITRILALRHPQHGPAVRAVQPEFGWMLRDAFHGRALSTYLDPVVWQRALLDFAHIQIDLIDAAQSLIELGVPDFHLDFLATQAERLLVALPDDLNPQERDELTTLIPLLRSICFELAEADFPLSLTHGNLHPDHIFVGADNVPQITNWADVTISHPLFDMITLLQHLPPALVNNHPQTRMQLLMSTLEPWREFARDEQLHQIIRAARVIAPLHRAILLQKRIMPNLEHDTRWEIQQEIPVLLRQCLYAANTMSRS